MKVCVFGLWHLGTVTAACLANAGHDVIGIDTDARVIGGLSAGTPPLFEPGLQELLREAIAADAIRFTTEPAAAADAEVIWVAHDTPVDDDDNADVEYVVRQVALLFDHLRDGSLVLISSQLPVGTTRRVEKEFGACARGRSVGFGCTPENLRLGDAIKAFREPLRVVVGLRRQEDRERVTALMAPFSSRIEWMSVESAEMTKHALNAFLATSVTFINEIALVCESEGADALEVSRGLKTDERIGPRAYLSPGSAFAGGTLARDVVFLAGLGRSRQLGLPVLSSVKVSNDEHRQWAGRRLEQLLPSGVNGKTIAVWGLTYKPGTDTLRRSSSVELCEWLSRQGARVKAHDPSVRSLPPHLSSQVVLASSALDAVGRADALVVATPWPVYKDIDADAVAARLAGTLVLDANRFLVNSIGRHGGLHYVSVGKADV